MLEGTTQKTMALALRDLLVAPSVTMPKKKRKIAEAAFDRWAKEPVTQTYAHGTVSVPQITDDLLDAVLRTMQPLVKRDGRLWTIEPVDPRKVTFNWDPKLVREITGWKELDAVLTQHRHGGYHGFFKPSAVECVAQMRVRPESYVTQVKDAETMPGLREYIANGFYIDPDFPITIFSDGSGHIARTVYVRIEEAE